MIITGIVAMAELSFDIPDIDSLIGAVTSENELLENVFFMEFVALDATFATLDAAFTAAFFTLFAVFTTIFFAVVNEPVRLLAVLLAKFDLTVEFILLDETIDYDK